MNQRVCNACIRVCVCVCVCMYVAHVYTNPMQCVSKGRTYSSGGNLTSSQIHNLYKATLTDAMIFPLFIYHLWQQYDDSLQGNIIQT